MPRSSRHQVRPLLQGELESGSKFCLEIPPDPALGKAKSCGHSVLAGKKVFPFDLVLGPAVPQVCVLCPSCVLFLVWSGLKN